MRRILSRLESAERREVDPWLRDDYRIAWITVLRASEGCPLPHVAATYTVIGLHPEKVWPAILARRRFMLGQGFESFYGEGVLAKKPPRSVRSYPQRLDPAA